MKLLHITALALCLHLSLTHAMNISSTSTNDSGSQECTDAPVIIPIAMYATYIFTKEGINTFRQTQSYVKTLEGYRDAVATSQYEECENGMSPVIQTIPRTTWEKRIRDEKRQGYTFACYQCAAGIAYGVFAFCSAYTLRSCSNNK